MPGPRFLAGKCYQFRDLKFYAMNGCIVIIDEEDGTCVVVTCKEFLLRAKSLAAASKRLASSPVQYEDRTELLNMVEAMITCIKEAKQQGDHFDPQVEAWFARHRPDRKGRNVRFATALPAATLPRGRHTGRTAAVDGVGRMPGGTAKRLILP